MWADATIFQHLQFPKEQFETHVLNWLQPLHKNETLTSYINRLSEKITHPNPVFIGVSFGGMIAQELASKYNSPKTVIISSIKHQTERTPFYTLLAKTKLYKLTPISFLLFLEQTYFLYADKKTKKKLEAYRKYLPFRNKIYTQWAIHHFLTWQQKHQLNTLHIHGNADTVIPTKYIRNFHKINNGTHAIILTKTKCIQHKITTYLA